LAHPFVGENLLGGDASRQKKKKAAGGGVGRRTWATLGTGRNLNLVNKKKVLWTVGQSLTGVREFSARGDSYRKIGISLNAEG